MGLEYYSVDQFALAHSADIKGGVLKTSDTNLFRSLSDYLEPISDTLFKFNKQLFLDYANISLISDFLSESLFFFK